MTQGVVKSTTEAIQAIDNMKRTINGGLLDSISTFVSHGDSLNPENFAVDRPMPSTPSGPTPSVRCRPPSSG